MVLEKIVFVWVIISIIYFGWKWIKERRRAAAFIKRMKNYDNPLSMSIGRRLRYKRKNR